MRAVLKLDPFQNFTLQAFMFTNRRHLKWEVSLLGPDLIASFLCSFSLSSAEEPKVRGIRWLKILPVGLGPLKLETHLR